ncbi:hypothetical protein [Streptomyces sp. NPDC006477]|uniref:hypothetical protein n=1 Tax=Streptomyces sp. NPDC006477 TaxID=3364747 RepID=UPI0036C95F40
MTERIPTFTAGEIARWQARQRQARSTNLHLVITRPEPGEWLGRLDVVEALEAAGWTGDDDMPLSILRHPSGAVFGVSNEDGDSSLDCANGEVIEFPSGVPTVVIVAACLAAAHA